MGQNKVFEIQTQLDCNQSIKRLLQALFSLAIKCRRCAKCCDGSYFKNFLVLDEDTEAIIKKTGWELPRFKRICKYAEYKGKSKPYIKQPCPFLVSGNCSIYDVRPTACRMFPVALMTVFLKSISVAQRVRNCMKTL
jgi:Fe-S-cluster containining protein